MSVEIPGPPYDYAAPAKECLALFPANITPEFIFMDMQGVIKGPLAAGGAPPPPNGVVKVKVFANCNWQFNIAGNQWIYTSIAPFAAINIFQIAGVSFFFAPNLPLGTMAAANTQTDPGVDKYYGGWVNISYQPPSGPKSVVTIADNWGILPGEDVFVSPRPKDAAESVYAYQTGPDRTNIKIKIENP